MSWFHSIDCDTKKLVDSLVSQACRFEGELKRIKSENEFLKMRLCELSKGNYPGIERHEVVGHLNCFRSDLRDHAEAIKGLRDGQRKIDALMKTLVQRTDTIRDTQEDFERRMKKLECKNNTVNVIIKSEVGDAKIEQ